MVCSVDFLWVVAASSGSTSAHNTPLPLDPQAKRPAKAAANAGCWHSAAGRRVGPRLQNTLTTQQILHETPAEILRPSSSCTSAFRTKEQSHRTSD